MPEKGILNAQATVGDVCVWCICVGDRWLWPKEGGEKEEQKWYDKIDFFGDFRLRYEGFDWGESRDSGPTSTTVNDTACVIACDSISPAQVTSNVKLGFEVRSGNPQNPISDNRSFDDGFDKDAISIAQAYAQWDATPWFSVIGGKFWPSKLWTVSDLAVRPRPHGRRRHADVRVEARKASSSRST